MLFLTPYIDIKLALQKKTKYYNKSVQQIPTINRISSALQD